MSKFKFQDDPKATPAQATPMGASSPGALATLADVEAIAGRPLTLEEQGRVSRLLEMASALVRSECGQTLSLVSGDVWATEVWQPVYQLLLPQVPVVSVSSVEIDGEPVTDFSVKQNGRMTFDPPVHGFGLVDLEVVYDHGYTEIPDDVVSVVAELAWGRVSNPQGLRSVGMGDYQATFATEGASSGFALTADMRQTLRPYGRRLRSWELVP